MSRRVVITGMGVISPVGVGLDTYWNNLTSGQSGIVPVTKFDTTDCPVKIGGEVPTDFNPEDFLDKKKSKDSITSPSMLSLLRMRPFAMQVLKMAFLTWTDLV